MKHMNLRNTLNAGALIDATIVAITTLAAPAVQSVTLPQRIAAAELKRMLVDLPGTFEIVEVRPPAEYADFSLPGSINASIVVQNKNSKRGSSRNRVGELRGHIEHF